MEFSYGDTAHFGKIGFRRFSIFVNRDYREGGDENESISRESGNN